ncbi:MAG: tetratricopeptide repeat protein [Pirellulales bacterium]
MRKAWLTTIAAASTALAASSAVASPAGMALHSTRPAKSNAQAVTARPTAPQGEVYRPSSLISPTQHPFKYFAAAMSELPIGSDAHASANPVMPPARQHNDAIALSKAPGPPTPELFVSMAQMSERQGDFRQARQHYGKALSMWPGHVEVLRQAARMEDRVGEFPLAESLYRQAVIANPRHAGALNDLGLCLARQGKLEASVQAIEQAINISPEKALYRNNVATVLVEMRQDQRALGHMAAVHGPADANYNLGQLLVERGRPAEATPYFHAAVEQNPQLQSAHVALAKLQGKDAPDAAAATSQPTAESSAPPAATPGVVPQQAPPVGPQLNYPATARSPGFGTSTFVPPARYVPTRPFPAAGPPPYGAAPTRYLPPIAGHPHSVPR